MNSDFRPKMYCDRCVYGRGEHADWCPSGRLFPAMPMYDNIYRENLVYVPPADSPVWDRLKRNPNKNRR